MKIVTWNINSIRSRLLNCVDYVKEAAPDILLLQELKCENDNFPFMEFEELGYNIALHGQKSYNGVAILSKYPLSDVIRKLPGDDSDNESRYIEAVASIPGGAIRVASVYVPNGQEVGSEKFKYKLNFFDRVTEHVKNLLSYEEIMVIGGDYNVAPENIDVYDPKSLNGTTCFHPLERAKFRSLTATGVNDAYRIKNPSKQQFSWWDYRGGGYQNGKGMRIDHLLLSPEAIDIMEDCDTDEAPRAKEKPSDHAPVWVKLKL